jgi:hypothetical protein
MTMKLNLYTTSHCHLCEQAESMLAAFANDFDLQWSTIEIADDASLLNLYEIKIPVLKRLDNNHEICWPFTLNEIIKFIK